MSELEDIKLKAFMQDMELESPAPNFSVRVMNKIFEEENVLEKIKSQKLFGKGFWIIIVLFIALIVWVLLLKDSGAEGASQLQSLLPSVNSEVGNSYQSLLGKMGSVPLGIAGILGAASVLLFLDRFISSNSKIFA